MNKQHKIGHCNIALLKSDVLDPIQALVSERVGELQQLSPKFKSPKTVWFLKKSESQPSPWQEFANAQVKEELVLESTINKSLLVFFEINNRWFVAMFGTSARFLVKSECLEHDFGYTVANRVVDPEQISNIEIFEYGVSCMKTKKQLSQGASIGLFGLNPFCDNLKTLSGKTKDPSFGKRVDGKRALVIHQSLTLIEVFEKCEKWLEVYSDPDRFEPIWSNLATPVFDPSLIEDLDNQLITNIRINGGKNISVGPPEHHESERVEGFQFSNVHEETTLSLSLSRFLKNMDQHAVTKEIFLRNYVQEKRSDTGFLINKWSVWDCLEYEILHKDMTHCLQHGVWYALPKTIVEMVDKLVDEIPQSSSALTYAKKKEPEFTYNTRIGSSGKLILMDRDLLRAPGYPSGIELCDLVNIKNAELIHIKRGTHSSDISHLIKQGTNSITMVIKEPSFREAAIKRLSIKTSFSVAQSFFNRNDLTVTYGIITKKKGKWSKVLPFFSKLTLLEALRELNLKRINVRLLKIEELDDKPKTISQYTKAI